MSKLFIVPTPVGNLGDITLRAIETLRSADLILAEDTRTSGVLLAHLDIKKPLQSYHKFNEHAVTERVADMIAQGRTVALVSDAGTPGISDPGFMLVRECVERGIEVETLPGATALVPALVNSGLPCDRFCFEGFLPQKKGRKTAFERLSTETRTIVLYESPHRVIKTLEAIVEYFPHNPRVSVSREISKKFEQTVRGTASELLEYFSEHAPKGEFVIVIEGNKNGDKQSSDEEETEDKKGKRKKERK